MTHRDFVENIAEKGTNPDLEKLKDTLETIAFDLGLDIHWRDSMPSMS